jgi:PAS domain-containing protein
MPSVWLAAEAADVGTWDLDLTTDVLTWSDRTKAMFGISSDAPVSMTDFYAGLHPEDLEVTAAAFASAIDPAIRATYDVEYRTIGKEDGVTRWVARRARACSLRASAGARSEPPSTSRSASRLRCARPSCWI